MIISLMFPLGQAAGKVSWSTALFQAPCQPIRSQVCCHPLFLLPTRLRTGSRERAGELRAEQTQPQVQ